MNLLELLATNTAKAILVAVLIFIAHKWSNGDFDKNIKNLKQMRKDYGIITIAFIVVWWVLTPSGSPDDYILLWLIGHLGIVSYLLLLGLLTIYIIWRLRVTIVIYRR